MKSRRSLPLLFTAVVLAVLVATAPGWAYPNEPVGFNGLKWGTTSTDGLEFLEEDPASFDQIFVRFTDSMSVGGVDVYDIQYVYNFMQEFYQAVIRATGMPKYRKLSEHLSQIHGPPAESVQESRQVWRGGTTEIRLVFDGRNSSVTLTYTGVKVVEGALKGLDEALDAVGGSKTDSKGSEDPFKGLFD